MIEESIQVALVIANEEKNTLNYISVISDVLAICTLKCTLQMQEVANFALVLFELCFVYFSSAY